jgi:mRNA interferase RelE/StbE
VAYALVYHRAVADLDLPRIPTNVRSRIARAIEGRLTTSPERFGTPLKATLRGYWKLRVGDYRVVFRIVGVEVRILAILHRRIAYAEAPRRARLG